MAKVLDFCGTGKKTSYCQVPLDNSTIKAILDVTPKAIAEQREHGFIFCYDELKDTLVPGKHCTGIKCQMTIANECPINTYRVGNFHVHVDGDILPSSADLLVTLYNAFEDGSIALGCRSTKDKFQCEYSEAPLKRQTSTLRLTESMNSVWREHVDSWWEHKRSTQEAVLWEDKIVRILGDLFTTIQMPLSQLAKDIK